MCSIRLLPLPFSLWAAHPRVSNRAHPDAFAPESGAWGRAGSARILLPSVIETVRRTEGLRAIARAGGRAVGFRHVLAMARSFAAVAQSSTTVKYRPTAALPTSNGLDSPG